MSVREEVLQLVDGLSESDLATVRRLLRALMITRDDEPSALVRALGDAPDDDEPETNDEAARTAAAWTDVRAGNTVTRPIVSCAT